MRQATFLLLAVLVAVHSWLLWGLNRDVSALQAGAAHPYAAPQDALQAVPDPRPLPQPRPTPTEAAGDPSRTILPSRDGLDCRWSAGGCSGPGSEAIRTTSQAGLGAVDGAMPFYVTVRIDRCQDGVLRAVAVHPDGTVANQCEEGLEPAQPASRAIWWCPSPTNCGFVSKWATEPADTHISIVTDSDGHREVVCHDACTPSEAIPPQ